MEVNGRFWGSLQLAVDAGVDFPWLLYRLAVGQPVEVSGTWRVGVRSRWLLGDLDSLYWRWFRSDGLYTVGENVRATADFLRFCGDARFEVNRWRDFRPFLREMGEYLNSNVFGNRYFVALKSRVERIFPSAPS